MSVGDVSARIDPVFLPAGELPPMALAAHNLVAVRESLDARRAEAVLATDPGSVAVSGLSIDVGGRCLPLRIYRGTAVPAPTVLFCHSGGYVLGNLDTDHHRCLELARLAQCTVVSVDYRLAPEHPYPAGLDDCFAVLVAVAADPERYDADGEAWAVAGSSAGGGLAAALAARVRDELPAIRLRYQLLHQPMLDRRLGTASMAEFETTPYFDSVSARFAWAAYVGSSGSTRYLSPAEISDLAGLPPAYIACSEVDPLRDEAIDYAQRLLRAGVPTELHVYPGTCHGFDSVSPVAPVSRAAMREQAEALAAALA